MATNVNSENGVPEFLYHVKRTIIDYAQDKSGATRITDILGTFTDLAAAKLAARSALASESYLRDDFEEYEENNGTEDWKHGDGVIVFAKVPAGQVFEVSLVTNPNLLRFHGNASGEVEGPLHYGKHYYLRSSMARDLIGLQYSRPQSITTMIGLVASRQPTLKGLTPHARPHSKLQRRLCSTRKSPKSHSPSTTRRMR